MYKAICTAAALLLLLTACAGNVEQEGESEASELTWQDYYDLGIRYLSEGNYAEAILVFMAAIEIDPKQALAYMGRGNAYIGSGETEENLAAALADYERAIELDETSAEAYLGLADVYIRQGEYDKALEILRIGHEMTEDDRIVNRMLEIENTNNINDKMADPETNGNIPKNLLIRENWYNENGLWNYTEYFYNTSGTCIEEKTTLHDGEVLEHIKYDEFGNEIWHLSYHSDDITEYKNTYDESGRLIRRDTDIVTTYYFYEDSGLTVRHESNSTHGTDNYDEDGNLIMEEWYWDSDLNKDYAGLLINRYYYEYDENGLLIASIWPKATEGIWHPHEGWRRDFIYEFGPNGLPVKRYEYLDGEKTADWWEYFYS